MFDKRDPKGYNLYHRFIPFSKISIFAHIFMIGVIIFCANFVFDIYKNYQDQETLSKNEDVLLETFRYYIPEDNKTVVNDIVATNSNYVLDEGVVSSNSSLIINEPNTDIPYLFDENFKCIKKLSDQSVSKLYEYKENIHGIIDYNLCIYEDNQFNMMIKDVDDYVPYYDYIYYTRNNNIYRYDRNTKDTVLIREVYDRCLHIDGNRLYYIDIYNQLNAISLTSNNVEASNIGYFTDLVVHDNYAYYLNKDSHLCVIDLSTLQEKDISKYAVSEYFINDKYIFFVLEDHYLYMYLGGNKYQLLYQNANQYDFTLAGDYMIINDGNHLKATYYDTTKTIDIEFNS